MTPPVATPADDAQLHPLSGEFVDPAVEAGYRSEQLGAHLHLYAQVALLLAIGFSAFSVLDLASLGVGAAFGALLVARASASALVLYTRHRVLRDPERFAVDRGLDLILLTQVGLYAVVLLACAARPADAATNAVSVAVLVLGAMVLVPGRFWQQAALAVAMIGAFTVVAGLGYHDPPLAPAPLVANLAVAVAWGATILRLTNRDSRRRWAAVRDGARANDRLEQELAASDRLRAELQMLARQDPLTSAANRRELLRAAEELLADRRRTPLSLLLMDADRFKSINDQHGHAAGDAALVAMVDAARAAVRGQDLVARVGGEEFAVLLPDLAEESALAAAERVRRSIEAVVPPGHQGWRVSVSIGVATAQDGDTVERLLARADRAMYAVKRDGGNGVRLDRPAAGPTPPDVAAAGEAAGEAVAAEPAPHPQH